MVRGKNNKSATERLDAILASPLYTKCKQSTPKVLDRIRLVEGDLQHVDAAISKRDRAELIENVEMIIHAGSAVRADASLLDVGRINVRGTREILCLAKEIPDLKSFAYISTAFSHCYQNAIAEEFSPPPLDPDRMIGILEHPDSVAVLDAVTHRMRYPWPNNYTFSMALSEELVRRAGDTMPITVIRPSIGECFQKFSFAKKKYICTKNIVLSTNEDPITGYNTSTYGVNGMMVAGAMGLMRIAAANPQCRSHIICSDFVVSATLSAMWNRCIADADEEIPKIYTVTVNQDDLRWGNATKQTNICDI